MSTTPTGRMERLFVAFLPPIVWLVCVVSLAYWGAP